MPQDQVPEPASEAPEVEKQPSQAAAQEPGSAVTPPPGEKAGTPAGTPPEQVPQRRGCSLFTWIVILAVVIAVAAYLVHRAQVEELKRQQAEQMERRAVRATQLQQVGQDLAKALDAAQRGDISTALLILEAQDNVLGAIAKEASASQDAEDANDVISKKAAVARVRDAIRQKEEEVKALAVQEISGLGTHFPRVRPSATAEPSEQKPEEASSQGQNVGQGEVSIQQAPVAPQPGAQPAVPTPAPAPATGSGP